MLEVEFLADEAEITSTRKKTSVQSICEFVVSGVREKNDTV